MKNINTAKYWDSTYQKQLDENNDWRNYQMTFAFILDEIDPSDIVMELGCGTGILGAQIIEKLTTGTYIGYDISQVAVEAFENKVTRGKIDIFIKRLDVLKDNLLFTNVLIATEFLEHFHDDELEIVMNKIKKRCVRAIFAVPNDHWDNSQCPEHYQKWTKKTFREMLSKYFNKVIILDYMDRVHMNACDPKLLALCSEVKR